MKLRHNVECFGYLIYSKVENKKIAYITDTTIIPKLPKNLDLLICECNWQEDLLYKYAEIDFIKNTGYLNHLCKEQLIEYFDINEIYPKNLILSHLSNSGFIDIKTLANDFKEYAKNVFVALKGLKVSIE